MHLLKMPLLRLLMTLLGLYCTLSTYPCMAAQHQQMTGEDVPIPLLFKKPKKQPAETVIKSDATNKSAAKTTATQTNKTTDKPKPELTEHTKKFNKIYGLDKVARSKLSPNSIKNCHKVFMQVNNIIDQPTLNMVNKQLGPGYKLYNSPTYAWDRSGYNLKALSINHQLVNMHVGGDPRSARYKRLVRTVKAGNVTLSEFKKEIGGPDSMTMNHTYAWACGDQGSLVITFDDGHDPIYQGFNAGTQNNAKQ